MYWAVDRYIDYNNFIVASDKLYNILRNSDLGLFAVYRIEDDIPILLKDNINVNVMPFDIPIQINKNKAGYEVENTEL